MLDEKMEMQNPDEAQEIARVKGRVERIVSWLNTPTGGHSFLAPRWHFWNPFSGIVGGLIGGIIIGIMVAIIPLIVRFV